MSNFRTDPAKTTQETVRRWAIGQQDIEKLRTVSLGEAASAEIDAEMRLAMLGLLQFSTWELTQLGREVLETAPPNLQPNLFEHLSFR